MVRKEEIMKSQNFFNRWIMSLNEASVIEIEERSCTRHMPVNRKIREVGFYLLDSVSIGDITYLYTYHKEEHYMPKTEVMLHKMINKEGKMYMADLEESDKQNLDLFYEEIFKIKRKIN